MHTNDAQRTQQTTSLWNATMRASSLENLSSSSMGWGSAPLAVDLFKGPEGLGFNLMSDEPGVVRVHSITQHGGAAHSDLRVNDRLLALNNIPLQNLPLDTVVAILKSTQEGPLTLLVARDAAPLALTMGSPTSRAPLSSPPTSAPSSPTKSGRLLFKQVFPLFLFFFSFPLFAC